MLHTIKICSGITHGRVFTGELYAQTFQKFIYLLLDLYSFDDLTLTVLVTTIDALRHFETG